MAGNKEEQTLTLTAANLKDIIAAAVAEARKPSELEQLEIDEKKRLIEAQRAKIAQDQETRRETAQQQIEINKQKLAFQRVCSHKHRDGNTHCAFINDAFGGFILCQKCQAVIRAGQAPKGYNGSAIFDTDLYNRLFQETPSNERWE